MNGNAMHHRLNASSSEFPNLFLRIADASCHFLNETTMAGTKRKILWFVLFAALLGWFTKDGTNQGSIVFDTQPWESTGPR